MQTEGTGDIWQPRNNHKTYDQYELNSTRKHLIQNFHSTSSH